MRFKEYINKIFISLIVMLLSVFYVDFGFFYLFLLLHEAAHCTAGIYLGYKVDYIKILPFGFTANFKDEFIKPLDDFIISISGPLINFVFFVLFSLLEYKYNAVYAHFKNINILILVFNLIPAGFLDGGRIVRNILMQYCNFFFAITLTNLNGIVFGGIILIVIIVKGAVIINIPVMLLGVFFIFKSIIDQRNIIISIIKISINKQNYIMNKSRFKVKMIVSGKDVKLLDIIKYFCFNYYHVIYILEAGKIAGKLDEMQLITLYCSYGNISLEKGLKYIDT